MGGRIRGETCRRDIAYRPLPSQSRFHKSAARFKGFSGPIGSGKSQALCQEAIKLSYLNPGLPGLIGAPTYPMLRDSTQAALLETLEENGIPFELHKSENMAVLKDTGSRILFRPLEEFERLRGMNLAWFGVDELTYTPEEAWIRLEGRLREPRAAVLCGFAVWTPKGFDWVHRRFVSDNRAGYELIRAKPRENRYLLDRVPDFYDRLGTSYDALFFRQEVLGEYLNVQQERVYHCFERAKHVGETKLDAGAALLWSLDFNVDPMCSVVAQVREGKLVVLDEIVLRRASTRNACEEFYARYPSHPAGIVIYGDASGGRMQTSGMSDYQVVNRFFAEHGLSRARYKVPDANPPVRERVALANAKLQPYEGEPSVVIDPRCKELVRDLEEVTYKDGTTVIDKEGNAMRTHLSDAFSYLIWQEFQERPKIGERSRRLF